MKKRSALFLALPASLFLQATLISHQSYEAATVSFVPISTIQPSNTISPPLKIPPKTKAIKILSKSAGKAKKKDGDGPKYVSLTFDDGPSPVYTAQILAILKREGIHATFCVIGREAKRYPFMLQQIVAEGHKIADHSMNHDLNLRKRSDKKIREEILETKTLIETIVPGATVEYFRAPGGNWSPHLRDMVQSWGMKPLGWSVDTKDWQKPGVNEIISKVDAELHPGGVILMHDSGGDRSETVEALEKVIAQLKKDGYQFVFPG